MYRSTSLESTHSNTTSKGADGDNEATNESESFTSSGNHKWKRFDLKVKVAPPQQVKEEEDDVLLGASDVESLLDSMDHADMQFHEDADLGEEKELVNTEDDSEDGMTANTLRAKGFEIRKSGVMRKPSKNPILEEKAFSSAASPHLDIVKIPECESVAGDSQKSPSGSDDSARSISPAARSKSASISTIKSAASLIKIEVERSASPMDAPASGEFGIRFNQMNEFIRFGNIGNGASASVAKCIRFDGDEMGVYALKMLAVEQRWKRKQLVKELSTLYRVHADFDHLGIVKFNGATYQEGTALIVLEYMNRGSLLSLIEEYGKIEEKFLKPIAKQVLYGLKYLHQNKQLHRDLKPANILINRAGMCKISDFGIAADLAHSPSSMCHSYVGTHMYMSPERITARPYSYESDIWSFGLTLVHCATGRKPYEAKGGVLALIQEITSNAQHLLPEEEFSAEFKSFLSVCLAKEPTSRWTASQLLDHPFLKDVDVDDLETLSPPWNKTTSKDLKDLQSVCEILYRKKLKDASNEFISTPSFKQNVLKVVESLGVSLDEFLNCLEETIIRNSSLDNKQE